MDSLEPRFSVLNFIDAAAAWLYAYQLRTRVERWDELCLAVCTRFDKDQYQIHMKQLAALKQTSLVAIYLEQYEKLAHNILLYNDSYDDVFMVTHFLGGLKEEIRAPIILHCPQTLDIASSLALLQEEELQPMKNAVGVNLM